MSKSLENANHQIWAIKRVPIGAFVANQCCVYLVGFMPKDTQKVFKLAIRRLGKWWPSRMPPLIDIYEHEITDCWVSYYRQSDNVDSEKLSALLINGFYVQLRIFERYEEDDPERRILPGDLEEIWAGDLLNLIIATKKALPSDKQVQFEAWICSFASTENFSWDTPRWLGRES
ncbi:MAG: hypothetical protein GY807_11520 [Gammaproteobacteria bacterium]|nr:hypothetical protein [Gammaproteobacteria bacterium]